MIWHIISRELLDHLTSLRFALTTLILIALMGTNAAMHLRNHPERVRKYSENVTAAQNALESRTQLYLLLQKGPGNLYKRPPSLAFIADGKEASLPEKVENGGSWSTLGIGTASLKSVWWMGYPHLNLDALNALRPTATVIDWVFIITYLLSLLPLLFTFDALSGERERGTLRLCLANPISRPAFLIGKFSGGLIAVLIPFYLAILCNLAIISTNSWTQLSGTDWGRLGVIILIASCYTALFIAVGLIISATTRESRFSLVVLLLIWVTVVVFTPSTLGTLATKWMPPVETHHQFQMTKRAAIAQIESDFLDEMSAAKARQLKGGNILSKLQKLSKMSPEAAKASAASVYDKSNDVELRHMAARVNKDVEIREHFNRRQLEAQSAQVQHARAITQISPAAIVQYSIESMAGTGFNRHLQFLEHVHLYLRQFRNFIVEMDSRDTESLHIIGIPKGMSKKPVSPRAIPKFEDKITFTDAFRTANMKILMLFLLLSVSLFVAFLVFSRASV